MARIRITDSAGVDIVSANQHVNSRFGKYLKGKPAALLAGARRRQPASHALPPGHGR
jgi:hypothetical protein